MSEQAISTGYDVTVIGGGLAGKAASLHLAKAGLKVACIEPARSTRAQVGESLDWSAPELLKALGLPMEQLVESRMATWKRHVTIRMRDGCSEHYVPSTWLGGWPFYVELRTLHIDRFRLDQEILRLATDLGVEFVRDKVVRVDRDGERISSIRTAGGSSFSSPLFIDASGVGASLLAREFNLSSIQFGPPKVAVWAYFPVSESVEGTTLYMDPAPSDYLDWVWEIPINPQTVSVGYIASGASIRSKRERGLSIEEIFRQQLAKFSRFETLLEKDGPAPVNVTSFTCRAYKNVAGPNWLIAGEAASMVDPMTSNGVTAALRHAAEASALILKFRKRGKLSKSARIAYNSRILQFARFFNGGIEKIVYEPPVRNRIGLPRSGTIYTSPAWSMNVVYARLNPKGLFSTFLFGSSLGVFRLSNWILHQVCSRLRPAASMAG
jgi:menaquinone-9 beta-reductase